MPPHVDAAIGRALEKLAADRFATAKQFADALTGSGTGPVSGSYQAEPGMLGPSPARRAREFAGWALALVLATWLGYQQFSARASVDSPVVRANLDLPQNVRINDMLAGATLAISPQGDVVVYTSGGVTGMRIYARRVSELDAREISASAGRNLTFSPDGRLVAYTEGNILQRVSVDGGPVSTIATTGSAVPYGLAWSESDTIYVGSFSGLAAIPASGGDANFVRRADSADTRIGQRWPLVLPGGKAIVYASGSGSRPSQLAVLTLATGEIANYETEVAMPLRVIGDQLVYVSPSGGLMALRLDLGTGRPLGMPLQLEEGVLVDPTAGAKAALSRSGTLVYLRGHAQLEPVLVASDDVAPTPLLRAPGIYSTPRLSPDGGRMAITVFGATSTDLWVYSLARNTFERVTTEGLNLRPEWTPDGRELVFVSTREGKAGIWRQPVDGSGPASLLYQPDVEPFEAIVSPDMRWLVFRTAPGTRYPRDILAVPLTGERTVREIVTGPLTESLPRLSPDGKWLAYQSSETGRFEIHVRPFPERGSRVQVSDDGGTEAVWSRSGRTLHYRGPSGEIIAVDVTTGAVFSIGRRRVVLRGNYLTDASHANYDVAPDGRFLVLKRAGRESQAVIVHNWARELREKTARP